jgi:hypothetical protein
LKRASIIMFSGGIDSTHNLLRALTRTSDIVYAHHLTIKSINEPRWTQELAASRAISKYMRDKYRFFEYSEQVVDWEIMPQYHRVPYDILTASFFASQLTQSLSNRDVEARAIISTDPVGAYRPGWNTPERIKLHKDLFTLLDPKNKLERTLDHNCNKVDKCKELPQELLDMVWFCRRPRLVGNHYVDCKGCPACKETYEALETAGRKRNCNSDVFRRT